MSAADGTRKVTPVRSALMLPSTNASGFARRMAIITCWAFTCASPRNRSASSQRVSARRTGP